MKRTNWNRSWTFTPGTVPMKRGESRPVDLPHDFMIESKRDPASLTRRGDTDRHYAWTAELWLHDKADADRLLGRSAGADRAG